MVSVQLKKTIIIYCCCYYHFIITSSKSKRRLLPLTAVWPFWEERLPLPGWIKVEHKAGRESVGIKEEFRLFTSGKSYGLRLELISKERKLFFHENWQIKDNLSVSVFYAPNVCCHKYFCFCICSATSLVQEVPFCK